MLDFIILIALAAIPYSLFKIRIVKDRLNILSTNSEYMATHILMPHDDWEEYASHDWKDLSVSCIYESFLYQKVHAKTIVCTKCSLVSRVIVDNFILAKKINLDLSEGFYYGGIKCTDVGCKR